MFVQFLIILIPFLLKSIFTFAHFLTRMKYTYKEIYRIEYFKLNIQYIYTADDIKKKRYIKIFICILLYYYCIFLFSPFYLLYYCQRLHLLKHHDAIYVENPTWNKTEFGADMVDSEDNLVSFDYASFLSYINDVHDFEYTEESAWSGLKTSNVNDKNLYYYVFADMNPLNKRKNKLTLSKYSYIFILRQAVKKKDIIINIVLKDSTLYKNTSLWYNYWNNFIPIDYVSHAPYWMTVMYNFEQREYKEKYHLWDNPHNKWYIPLKSTDFWDSLSNIKLFFNTIYWKIFFSNTSLLFKKNVNNYNNFLNPVSALQNNLKKSNDAYPLIKNALTVVKTNDHLTFLTEYILNKKYGKWSNNLFFLPGVKENKLKNIFNYTSKHFTSWASSFYIESDYSKEYQENILYLFNKDWRLFHHWDITFIIPESYVEMVAHSYYYFMIQRDAYRYAKHVVGSFHEITSKEMQKGLKERYILTKINLYLFITDYNFYRVRYSNVSDHFDTYSRKITHALNYNIRPWGWNINYSKTDIEEDKELPDFVPEMVDFPYDNWILTQLNQGYLNLTYYFVDHIDWFLKIFFIRFFLNEQHTALEDHGLYFHRAVLFPWEYAQDQIEVMWIATQLALFYHYQKHFDEIHHFVAKEAKVRLVMYEKNNHWESEYKWFNSIKEYLIKLKKFRDIYWSEHLLVWHHLLVIMEMRLTYQLGMDYSYWLSRGIHRTFSNKKRVHTMHMDSFDAFVDYTIDNYDEAFIYRRLYRFHWLLDKIYQFPERLHKFFNYDVWYTPKKMFQSLYVDNYHYIMSTFKKRSYKSGMLFPFNEKALVKFKFLVFREALKSFQEKPITGYYSWMQPRFRKKYERKLQRFFRFIWNEKDETYQAPYYWSPDSILDKWRNKWQIKFPKITTTKKKKKEEQFFTISFYRQRNWWILVPFRLRNFRHTLVKSIQYFINIYWGPRAHALFGTRARAHGPMGPQ